MKIYRPKKGLSFLGLVFIFLILILGISLISLFYFNQKENISGDQEVKFWFYRHAEQEVGEENTFFIFIKNQEKRDLEQVEVVLKFPDGFILNSSSPVCNQVLNQGCLWSLDKIKKGELDEIEIKGQLFGRTDQDQMFTGNLNFHLAGFSSDFQKSMSSSIMLKPSIFLTWQIPEQSSFGQEIKSTVSLENIGQEMISQTEVVLNWPENFVLKKVESTTSKNDDLEELEIKESQKQFRWRIKDLNIKDQKGLEFEGFLDDPSTNELTFNLQAGVFYEDKFFLQTEKEKKVIFEKFDFNSFLEVNNSIRENQTAEWGEVIPVNLVFKNQSQQSIENFNLKLKLIGGQYVDFTRFYQLRWHYYQGLNTQVSSEFVSGKISADIVPDSLISFSEKEINGWNQNLISIFKEIKPGTEGIIVFDLPIKTSLEAAKNKYSRAEIGLQIVAQGTLVGKEEIWNILGNKVNLLLKTDAGLEASARYYDDEHVILGSGPLPPQIGEETRFWIFWRVKNTTNPLKNIIVKTKLPEGVIWTGKTKTSHGLALYGENDKEVNWNIPGLDIYQGGPYSLVEAGFEVKIIPDSAQLNKAIPLTGDIFLSAQDEFTNESISSQLSFLDTNLAGDFWGQNKGMVQDK